MIDFSNHSRHCCKCTPKGLLEERYLSFEITKKYFWLNRFNRCDECLQEISVDWNVPVQHLDKLQQSIKYERHLQSHLSGDMLAKAKENAKSRIKGMINEINRHQVGSPRFDHWLKDYSDWFKNEFK